MKYKEKNIYMRFLRNILAAISIKKFSINFFTPNWPTGLIWSSSCDVHKYVCP